jgi:hypothetical protein
MLGNHWESDLSPAGRVWISRSIFRANLREVAIEVRAAGAKDTICPAFTQDNYSLK